MFPHTAGFSGSCPVSENLTYGHSSRRVAGTKVLFILPPLPRLPLGPQMVWGVKLATLQSQRPPSPTDLQATAALCVHWSFLPWKTGCFKPWRALQMLKCDNRTMQVFQRHWGRLSCLTTTGVCLWSNLPQRKGGVSVNVDQKITLMKMSHLFPQFVF